MTKFVVFLIWVYIAAGLVYASWQYNHTECTLFSELYCKEKRETATMYDTFFWPWRILNDLPNNS